MLNPQNLAFARETRVRCYAAWVALLLLAVSLIAQAEKINDIRAQGYVTDLAGVIDPATRQKI